MRFSVQRLRKAVVTAMALCVVACSNGGNSDTDSASGPTTTLGTRSSISSPNPAITSNSSATWSSAYSRPDDYPNVVHLPLQFITLSSGQKLGVLVGLPGDKNGNPIAGSFPVILTQTAYRIDLGALTAALIPDGATLLIGGADKNMIKHGYVTVSVDVLGSGVSDGEEQLLGSAEQEAYGETVDWVLQQPWCNGNIGLAGTSYLGITSLLTAEQQNPAIKAVFVDVPAGDVWRSVIGTGGLLNGLFLSYWLNITQNLSVDNTWEEQQYPQFAQQIEAATQQHVATINDFFVPLINDGLNGVQGYATDDGDFWALRSPIENATKIQVPTFVIGANHDIFQRDEPLLYEQLKNSVTTKLIIVNGEHFESVIGAELNSEQKKGLPSSTVLLLQWFDQYLKGIDTGAQSLPNVTQYVIGKAQGSPYVTSTDWPLPELTPTTYYLHGDNSLSQQAPVAGELSSSVREPDAPTITVTSNSAGDRLQMHVDIVDSSQCSISFDQWTLGIAGIVPLPCYSNDSSVEKGQRAAVFTTGVLSSDLYINGPILANVWISTTASEAAVSVRVDDEDPSTGKITPITNGQLAASYRGVDSSRSRYIRGQLMQPWHPFTVSSMEAVTPNEPMLLPVEVFPTAALIQAGHKLRIAISSSNQAQGNWAVPMQQQASKGVTTIYNDADHPSAIVLPIAPSSWVN